ncbi:MAG: hypothetical protein M3N57_06270, partial [Actinomycetota bacterium]|nr:hypothetical protein [Actinomycetota bacterium]
MTAGPQRGGRGGPTEAAMRSPGRWVTRGTRGCEPGPGQGCHRQRHQQRQLGDPPGVDPGDREPHERHEESPDTFDVITGDGNGIGRGVGVPAGAVGRPVEDLDDPVGDPSLRSHRVAEREDLSVVEVRRIRLDQHEVADADARGHRTGRDDDGVEAEQKERRDRPRREPEQAVQVEGA